MRIIRLLHKWTGLIIGLFFMLSCLSGLVIGFGKLIDSYAPIFKLAKHLHKNMYCGAIGGRIIAIATLIALIEILTGYILWGRQTIALSRSYKRNGRNPRMSLWKNLNFRFPNKLTGWHIAGGFWSGIPLLIIILTCLTWCFGWYNDIVYSLFDSGSSGSWDSNLFHTLHNLHVGNWGGKSSRILWLLAVGLGASLPVTGFLLFFRRLSGKKKH
ncbi:MAG: PepSY domain-containing protein [Muribaculaceae bacterium]|nr:PepSY domain-containing protein [Muribaculaceae bacterium]